MANVPRKIIKQAPVTFAGKEYWVEITNDKHGFEHRIACADGRTTRWASYTNCTHMDGVVGCTNYYITNPDGVSLITARDYCAVIMVGVL